jgi:hypothetical protein
MFSVQKNACFNGVKGGFERQNTWHAKNGRPLHAMIFLVWPWHSTTNLKNTFKHRPDMYMQANQLIHFYYQLIVTKLLICSVYKKMPVSMALKEGLRGKIHGMPKMDALQRP